MSEEKKGKLTDKQKAFVQEYLVDMNGTQAAIRAGYTSNVLYAGNIAFRLLKKVDIQKALSAAKAKRDKRVGISQDRVMLELARVAFSSMKEFAKWDGNTVGLRDSDELSEDSLACVQEVSETVTAAGGSTKIKLHNKLQALELLMRATGMLSKDEKPQDDDEQERVPSMTKAQALEELKKRQKKS